MLCDLDLRDMTLGRSHDAPLGHGQQWCEILFRSNMAVVRSYGSDTDFGYVLYCDLDHGEMTLGQGHDTSLGHKQQLCGILSRSDKGVRSGLDTTWTYGQGDSYIPPNCVAGGIRVIPI